ncbi:MAG: DEAD/DEAH box helicase [Opitutales bacterium]|nr:DEAD/DEAH box helicase [Opitutales bacterium]NRA27494.1 DEAD/DEAH box helicase [Opitutales bacterium]
MELKIPDLWQQKAFQFLKDGKDLVLDAPTGAGKTYIFELLYRAGLSQQAVYTVPTRALANDKYKEWTDMGWNVGITTGDVSINTEAPVVVATLETQRQRLMRGEGPGLLVIDEYQMIGDRSRGVNYEVAIALAPPTTQLFLLSGSVANPDKVVRWLQRIGREARLVQTKKRPIPLDEVFFDAIPESGTRGVRGYWCRRIAKALANDLGPILVFTPHRKAAEDLARDLANQLQSEDPIALTQEQKKLAGSTLSRLIKSRIAFHHSGLSYPLRAGLIEPLAKNGQLRVVVATNGLGAGINFCMRSVAITSREFRAGDSNVLLRGDELLQMFGRAGRRGMDDRGYVLTAPGKPRLTEAAPLHLRRRNQVDWAVFLNIMMEASRRKQPPMQATQKLTQRLFSDQRVPLGLREFIRKKYPLHPDEATQEAEIAAEHLERRSVIELQNTKGIWERRRAPIKCRLKDTLFWDETSFVPALASSKSLSAVRVGMPTKLVKNGKRIYGRIVPIANFECDRGPDALTLHSKFRRSLTSYFSQTRKRTIHPPRRWTLEDFEQQILPIMPALTNGGHVESYDERKGTFFVTLDYSEAYIFAWKDSEGKFLINPPTRKRIHQSLDELRAPQQKASDSNQLLQARSPAEIWYQLRLIDGKGRPTRRGAIASFFQHGEGLAIAAALEDDSFPLDDLIYEIANIRAGHRFENVANASDRLRFTCREAYRSATYEGYLNKGLPSEYGDGAAEIMREYIAGNQKSYEERSDDLSKGDIERAYLEWKSMLFHILYAPEYKWGRWIAFRDAVEAFIEKSEFTPASIVVPELTLQQKQRASILEELSGW